MEKRPIENEIKTSYLEYAMSVIVSRAIPEVRDGLKPVQRRILYSMSELNVNHDKPYKKCARIVGETMGKYHPHGDMAIYEALARMAQDFSMRYLLVDGQGNFGSIDGDAPAAMRYTEARLTELSEEMVRDIEKNTVPFRLNFDGSLEEPEYFPTKVPNLLINGSSGIAVGMATNMVPHNLTEVCNAITYALDHRDYEVKELLKYIKGPDFPGGGISFYSQELMDAYLTGRGKVVSQGEVDLSEPKHIVIKSLPYGVNKAGSPGILCSWPVLLIRLQNHPLRCTVPSFPDQRRSSQQASLAGRLPQGLISCAPAPGLSLMLPWQRLLQVFS